MFGDREMNDFHSGMVNNEQDVENSETERRYRKKVHGCDHIAVVIQKGHPSLRLLGVNVWLGHVAGYGALGNLEPEHFELAMYSRRSPTWIGIEHLLDQGRTKSKAFEGAAYELDVDVAQVRKVHMKEKFSEYREARSRYRNENRETLSRLHEIDKALSEIVESPSTGH